MKFLGILLLCSGLCNIHGSLLIKTGDCGPGDGHGEAPATDCGSAGGKCYKTTCYTCSGYTTRDSCGNNERACCFLDDGSSPTPSPTPAPTPPPSTPQPAGTYPCDRKGGKCWPTTARTTCDKYTGDANDCKEDTTGAVHPSGPFCCLKANYPCDGKGGQCVVADRSPHCGWSKDWDDCYDKNLNIRHHFGWVCCIPFSYPCIEEKGGQCLPSDKDPRCGTWTGDRDDCKDRDLGGLHLGGLYCCT